MRHGRRASGVQELDTGEIVYGLAQNLDRDEVGAVLLGAVDCIKEGDTVPTTGRIMDIPAAVPCSAVS